MKTNDLPRTRTHAIPANFWAANRGAGSALVTTVDIAALVAMADCEHGDGRKCIVVSKPARGCEYTTTVLRVGVDGKWAFYRAGHGTGMVSFWKGVAKRRPGVVEFVRGTDEYQPQGRGQAMEGSIAPLGGRYVSRPWDSVVRFLPDAGPLPFNV